MSKTENKRIVKDVDVFWTADDIEKIQLKPNLYIQKYGDAGCNHMGREIIQNGYDECIDTTSPGSTVIIRYDKKTGKLTVIDDGRGFPETKYHLDIFVTKIQSGSKSNRAQSGGTAGEFGLGSTVVNALSTEFTIKSFRAVEKTIHTIRFENGKKVEDKIDKNPKGLHGSEVSFIPNPKYLGKGAKIDMDEMMKWINNISYLLSSEKKKLTIKVEIWNGTKCEKRETIKSRPFTDLLSTIVKKPLMEQVSIQKRGKFDEADINGKITKKDVLIEVAFVYDGVPNPDELYEIDSYCNYTNTKDGGTHVNAVDDCVCRFLQTKTRASLSDKEKEKIDILWQDIRTDLRMVINLTSNAQVQFVGNAKTKIANEELVPLFKELVSNGLEEFFIKNSALLNDYMRVIKRNAKARIELNKIKSVNTKIKTNTFSENMDDNFVGCNNRGKNYKEIYLVEGQKSAMGSIVNARNPDIQAVMGFRGNTANAYKRDITNIFDNLEWKQYCTKIHYDLKAKDVSSVYYNKIIIATDADSDGYGIASSFCAFHLKFARPIVEAGLLYRVYPPLYRLEDKNHPYVRNKEEMTDVYRDQIVRNFKIKLDSAYSGETLKKSDMRDFIDDTSEYLYMIKLIADHYYVSRELVEVIAYNMIMYGITKGKGEFNPHAVMSALDNQRFVTKLMKEIQKLMPEIEPIRGNRILGVVDGHYQALNITPKFLEKISYFVDIYLKYGIYCSYTEKTSPEKYGTLGDFLQQATKYIPKIVTRYKGLGEANWDQIAETIMDPAKRIIVQLTLDDLERDLEVMSVLHARTKREQELRKKMMKDYVLRRDEIDN